MPAAPLVAVTFDELGWTLLKIAKASLQNGMFNIESASTIDTPIPAQHSPSYARRRTEVETVLSEGWNWLLVNGLIVPAAGMNGRNGFMVFSRRGAAYQK
jgi:hypothetical protein